VSQQGYLRYESDKTIPPSDKLATLAEMFGVSTDYLLGRPPAEAASQTLSRALVEACRSEFAVRLAECGDDAKKLGALKAKLEKL
jgi:transcriptional regulator with XRE-family HTH domain